MLNDWHSLGVAQYRKWHVYDMGWKDPANTTSGSNLNNLSLENYLVSGAPFAGPIALFPDTKRMQNNTNDVINLKLTIYTSSGVKISEIEWKDRPVIAMGWTDQETLITVNDQGLVKIYDLHGRHIIDLSLLNSETEGNVTIVECHFWGNGVAAMSSTSIIKVAEGLSVLDIHTNKPRIYSLKTNLGTERSYTSMAIIPPLHSRSGLLEVLVGTSDNSILLIHENGNETDIEDQMLQQKIAAPIAKIALAPNGRFLACFRKDGILTVMSSSFTTKVLDFDTRAASKPSAVEWCGKDAVVIKWRNTGIVMVGPYGDWLNFPYDTAGVQIIPEPDCCRIITSTSCELLQIVPQPTLAALEIGSTEPAALILDAMEAFEEGDPKSDENIRLLASTNQLNDAVQSCITSAGAEFFPTQQQRLLKAASYGKAFCPDYDAQEFVETAKKLRVLNEVRKASIGMPLTIQQYNTLTAEVLVGRLTMRNHHFLALKICEYLRLRNERVLVHWACEKVRRMAQTNAVDEYIAKVIKKQLEPYGRVSFLAVAEAACNIGRRKLATMILDQEQHPHDQIPLLLRMNEEDLALQKAITTEDTDLIYYTLITIESRVVNTQDKSSIEKFYRMIAAYPEAANLMKIYYSMKMTSTDRTWLQNFLMFTKNYLEAGNAAVQQSSLHTSSSALSNKIACLKEAATLYSMGKGDALFYRSLTEEHLELLEMQKKFELRSNNSRSFVNLTLNQTIHALINLSLDDPVEARWVDGEVSKLVRKFRVLDKTLYYMKLQIYSRRNEWELLQRLSQEKKPPVGYKPFALACIKAGRPDQEIERYIEKISDLEEKYELYMDMKSYMRAAEMAAKLRDAYRLHEVGRLCRDNNIERYVQDAISKI